MERYSSFAKKVESLDFSDLILTKTWGPRISTLVKISQIWVLSRVIWWTYSTCTKFEVCNVLRSVGRLWKLYHLILTWKVTPAAENRDSDSLGIEPRTVLRSFPVLTYLVCSVCAVWVSCCVCVLWLTTKRSESDVYKETRPKTWIWDRNFSEISLVLFLFRFVY